MTDTKSITGYKVFNRDWTCLGKQYSCPGEFEEFTDLCLCKSGIHFCIKLSDCFQYYPLNPLNHVAEVVVCGDISSVDAFDYKAKDTKRCTNRLEITKEISFEEVLDILWEEYKAFVRPTLLFNKFSDPFIEQHFKAAYSIFKDTKTNKENIILFNNLLNEAFLNKFSLADSNGEICVHLCPPEDTISFCLKISNPDKISYVTLGHESLLSLFNNFNSDSFNMVNIVNKYLNIIGEEYLRRLNKNLIL